MFNNINNGFKSFLPLLLILSALTFLYVCTIQYVNYKYREQVVNSQKKELEQAISIISDKLVSRYEFWQQSIEYFAKTSVVEPLDGKYKVNSDIAKVLPDSWALLNNQGRIIDSSDEKIKIPSNILNVAPNQAYNWSEFYMEDNMLYQYLISKISSELQSEVYVVLQIGSDQLSESIGKNLPYHVSLYNYEYKVVASNSQEKVGQAVINEITKKMLNGDTGIEMSDGRMTAYGFSDTNAGALYVTAWLDDSEIFKEADRFRMWSLLSILPAILIFIILAVWYRKMIIARETHQQRSRDVLHQESLLKRQDDLHLPFLQEINLGIDHVGIRLEALSGGEEMKLLGFYREIAIEWEQEEGLLLNPDRAEKKAFFDDLNHMFTQSRLKHEEEIEDIRNQLRIMGGKVTAHLQTGMNNELVDINLLIKETVAWTREHMDLSAVEVYFVAENIPAVLLHPITFRKIIVGLLENALEASRRHQSSRVSSTPSRKLSRSFGDLSKTKIQIHTRLEPQEIVVEMEDEGGGLDDKKRYQYFQENYSQSMQEYGLSLFRMDQYLKSINGKLKLRNTDVGLKATIRVPR
ncbi:ATP-binding protein [Paenibacillus xylanexedens]|uniref:ATP-binding protein n=1 Tax=Paenibacillus xylanexedens TaxID=528191 RepID=UPI0011A02083|nr:ATP-binding protein [Paenibacillus xylanexedens]